MSTLFITVCTSVGVIIVLKILLIWIKQVQKLLKTDVPNPGIPLPILGHSHHFFNTQPDEVFDLVLDWINLDIRSRKVIIC